MIFDLLLAVPLIGTIILFALHFFPQYRQTAINWIIALLSTGISFILIIYAMITIPPTKVIDAIYTKWFEFNGVTFWFRYYIDPWALILLLVSSLLTFLIVIFSKYYMGKDEDLNRYYALILLFLFGMNLLVVIDNLVLMFVGWEIVGICSWALIGFYYTDPKIGHKASLAGRKALLITALTDTGILVAVTYFAFIGEFSTSSIINGQIIPLWVGISLLIAAMGKSAQFPFHIWIASTDKDDIDAMQGPTTVSALIHAATMVNAGVFLVARIGIFPIVQEINLYIYMVGSITALIMAIFASFTYDLKRILAYSTISQLGYMIAAIPLAHGQFLGLYHLINHAMFKALLFLTAGVIIHTMHSRDIREQAGLQDKVTKVALVVGLFGLSGLPFSAGFFSKELIIETALHDQNTQWIGFLLSIAAIFTAVYIGRLLNYIFRDGNKENGIVTSSLAKSVLVILSFLSLFSMMSYFYLAGITIPTLETTFISISWELLISQVLVITGLIMGWYHTRISLPLFVKKPLHEGLYINKVLTGSANLITYYTAKFSTRMQTGQFFWNIFLFTIATGILSFALYWVNFGGQLP